MNAQTYQYDGPLDPDQPYYVPRKADGQLLQLCLHSDYAYIFNVYMFNNIRKTPPSGGDSCTPAQTRTVLFGSGGRRSVH